MLALACLRQAQMQPDRLSVSGPMVFGVAWGKWERWTDVRVRLTEIAGRVDQLLSRREAPTPADAGEVATGMVTMCAKAEAVLMRVGAEHRATLSPQAHRQVCLAVGQLHTVAETLEALAPLLDPAHRWPR